MQNTQPQTPLGRLWNSIPACAACLGAAGRQSWLFPMLEDEIGALDEKHRQFVAVCELCAPQDHLAAYCWCGNLPAPRCVAAGRRLSAQRPAGAVQGVHRQSRMGLRDDPRPD